MQMIVWLLLLILCSPAYAARVLKIGKDQVNIGVSHNTDRKWNPNDRVCVYHKKIRVMCGMVIKTFPKGAIVKLNEPAKGRIFTGDPVLAKGEGGYIGGIAIGLCFGASLGKLSVETEGIEQTNRVAIAFGVQVDFPLTDMFVLQPELLYSPKGYSEKTTPTLTTLVKINYLELPLLLRMQWQLGTVRPFVLGGPFMGYLLGVSSTLSTSIASEESDIKNLLKVLDYGFYFGAGSEVAVSPFLAVTLVWRFGLGLANIIIDDSDPTGTRTMQILGGIKYLFE